VERAGFLRDAAVLALATAAAIVLCLAGGVGRIAGAVLLVALVAYLAAAAGLSETVIGLTIVAIGTSLHELVTSASAALRGESGVAFGNVVGSNIFNLLGILGATALAVPLAVPPEVASRDVWALAAATALFVAVTGWRVTRIEGGGLVALFAAYMALLVFAAP
jgi:cation:H+ antiporter